MVCLPFQLLKNTLHEPFEKLGKEEWAGRASECVHACVCGGRGCVRFVSFILYPQLNPHQAADSGSMRCSGELANCMKDLTLFAHTAPQDTAFQILQQALQVQVHYHMKKTCSVRSTQSQYSCFQCVLIWW